MNSVNSAARRGRPEGGTGPLRQRLRASPFYDLYWRLRRPALVAQLRAETAFYAALLPDLTSRDLIFDIGANCGYKTGIFLRLGARVVAVEPDPQGQEAIERKYRRLRLRAPRVTVVGSAVASTSGLATMLVDAPGSALNTLSAKWAGALTERLGPPGGDAETVQVPTVTVDELIARFGTPKYIKIDVEGYELEALRGMHQAVPLLSFEVNLPEFAEEAAECLALLESLSPLGEFNYTADCSRGLGLSRWEGFARVAEVLRTCHESSVEVFWRPAGKAAVPRQGVRKSTLRRVWRF